MKKWILFLFLIQAICFNAFAAATHKTAVHHKGGYHGSIIAPQPTACVTSTFNRKGNKQWTTVFLKLTNTCGIDLDFQNVTVTFQNNVNINTVFWGKFAPLTYPDNYLRITSQPSGSLYLSTLSLHMPEQPWSNSILPSGNSITIIYGIPYDVATQTYILNSGNVYLNGNNPNTGTITLSNATIKPQDVSQQYAIINVTYNGQIISQPQVPWSGTTSLPGLTPGSYTLSPQNVSGSINTYQGTANPATLQVVASQTATSTISYAVAPPPQGKINVLVDPLPGPLSGYPNNPSVTFTPQGGGAGISATTPWNTTTTANLTNNVVYTFSTPVINFNSNTCTPTFNPTSLTSATTPPVTHLTYTCVAVQMDTVTLKVTGLNATTPSVNITLTPNDGSTPVQKTVTLTNGQGSNTVSLKDGVIYSVSSNAVPGYIASFNPQPITAIVSAIENITFSVAPAISGKMITYIPGWKTPPPAQDLANAGYTHAIVAFALFDTTNPGALYNGFSTVTKSYVTALHNAGLKVLLSIGGAYTDTPGTSVDFHQVVTAAASPQAFEQTFVQSVESYMTQFGFDGIDIDIEQGFSPGVGGTLDNPGGDIAIVIDILRKLHTDNPSIILSLVPQAPNISATTGFNNPWGTYASLAMNTYNILSWVGVQLYNTGCNLGIDNICYTDDPSSQNFSVAMAADLLENWPAKDGSGRPTGFQPYISHLTPDQVVLGYPAPNSTGGSDGRPVKSTSIIKSAIQCLRTGTGCGSYIPPKAYQTLGGVFNWEVTYDQDNGYKFAKDLKACVSTGNCS